MAKKYFNILDFCTEEEILSKLKYIGSKKLTETGHGFSTFGNITIFESAEKSTTSYFNKSKDKPAITLMEVVLAANRNYNKVVEPNIKRIEIEYPNLKSFSELKELLNNKTKEEFYEFWRHKDQKKYNTLKEILSKTEDLKKQYSIFQDDYLLMNTWGNNANLLNYNLDIIGSIPNIAVATFQHLRMVFGVDTIKPDQRVKEVLDYEFGLPKLSDINVIKVVEQIANISKLKVLTLDQIFVQYGSSHYNQTANKITIKQVVSNLKGLKVNNEIISKATLLTLGQIEKIK